MQFAFTEEQELLRREARDALANGGAPWTREELGSELGFLDQAVLFEELGRAGQGESFFDAERPREELLATLALEAVGIAAKALDLVGRVREFARAVRAADRRLPGGLAQARRHVRRDGAGTLAGVLGGVDGRPAETIRRP